MRRIYTYADIASRLGYTREYVRQMMDHFNLIGTALYHGKTPERSPWFLDDGALKNLMDWNAFRLDNPGDPKLYNVRLNGDEDTCSITGRSCLCGWLFGECAKDWYAYVDDKEADFYRVVESDGPRNQEKRYYFMLTEENRERLKKVAGHPFRKRGPVIKNRDKIAVYMEAEVKGVIDHIARQHRVSSSRIIMSAIKDFLLKYHAELDDEDSKVEELVAKFNTPYMQKVFFLHE